MDGLYARSLRRVLHFTSLMCHVNLHPYVKLDRRWREKVFIFLVHICYSYCVISVSLSTYFVYVYMFRTAALRDYIMKPKSTSTSHLLVKGVTIGANSSQIIDNLINDLRAARVNAKLVGSPYLEVSSAVAANCVTLIVIGFTAKVLHPLYFHYYQPFESELISVLMLSEKVGRNICNDMLQFELDKLENRCLKLHLHPQGARHINIRAYLDPLNIIGALYPFNRRVEWLVRLSKIFCLQFVGLALFGLLLALSLMIGLVHMRTFGRYKLETDPRDLLQLATQALLVIISFLAVIFYSSVGAVTVIDQVLSLRRLVDGVDNCIRRNSLRFKKPASSRVCATMNQQVLLVFLHYRLFVQQTRKTLPQQGLFLIMLTELGFVGPIVLLLQVSFMDPNMMVALNYVYGSLLALIAVFWLPFCYMQARCQTLYRSLHSLMAHVAYVQESRDTYSVHLIGLLCKELSEPHKLLDKLTVQKFGFKFAYNDYVRYYLYAVLLLLYTNNTQLLRRGNALIGRITNF